MRRTLSGRFEVRQAKGRQKRPQRKRLGSAAKVPQYSATISALMLHCCCSTFPFQQETPPPAKTRGRGDSLLPKQLDFQSETMSPVLLTERYGWQLAPDARLKFRARKTLSPTETYKGDTTQALRRCGALLPQYVPLVCPSFASRDLARDPDNPDSRNGHHGRAGRDPWSILDYIRDSLYWPSDAIFIDSECFGM